MKWVGQRLYVLVKTVCTYQTLTRGTMDRSFYYTLDISIGK